MKFDMNTIQHLGISMYAKLPPVLAELVANCWDADATEVAIELFDSEPISKHIIIRDDGNGIRQFFEAQKQRWNCIGKDGN